MNKTKWQRKHSMQKNQSKNPLQHPVCSRMLLLVMLMCVLSLGTACGGTEQNTPQQGKPVQSAEVVAEENKTVENVTVENTNENVSKVDDNITVSVVEGNAPAAPQNIVATAKPTSQSTVAAENTSQKEQDNMNAAEQVLESMPYDQKNDAELQAMIGEVYALRSEFTGQLNGMLNRARDEYHNLPAENRKKELAKMGVRYVKEASALEKQCDKRMDEILSRMKKHLQEQGQDTSLTKEIKKTYENEKSQLKSEYMNKVKGVV